jgi:hypothetical protein
VTVPNENEKILYGLVNVQAKMGTMGVVRQYDIFFTENGIALAVVASGLSVAAGAAGAAGFGLIGALVGDASHQKGVGKMRGKFQGLSLPQILAMNEKSDYLLYSEVTQIALKKGLTGISKMEIVVPKGKYQSEFSKDQFEVAMEAIKEKLAAKSKDA